ncbi:MAG: MgtC/SapB family protein [Planctomycetota bacterium]
MDILLNADTLIKILLSIVLGAAIGFEREIHGRAAGVRTHLLVCLGSTVIMIASYATAEPARLVVGIATGIGFIGAGEIIRMQSTVRGLTTAACLWLTAGIGVLVGLGIYTLSVIITAIALLAIVVFSIIESYLPHRRYCSIQVQAKGDTKLLRGVKAILSARKIIVHEESIGYSNDQKSVFIELGCRFNKKIRPDEVINAIAEIDGVIKVMWK